MDCECEKRRSGRAERKERICKSLLLLLLTLSLAAAVLQSLGEKPWQLYGTLGLLWDVELIPSGGLLFPLTQVGSALSGLLAWVAVRVLGLPYQIGLLLIPLLALAGALLLCFRLEFGRILLLAVLLPTLPVMAILFLITLATVPFAVNRALALQQTIYYALMLAVPVTELLLLHQWMQNRPGKSRYQTKI